MKIFNKKGIVIRRLMHFAYRILYAMFLVAAVIFLIKMIVYTSVPTADLEMEGLANRIYNDPAINYQDASTGRVYSGVIDMTKFKDESLTSSLQSQKKKICAQVELIPQDGTIPQSIYFRKELYVQLAPFVMLENKIQGAASGSVAIKQYPVLYKDHDVQKNAILIISVIRQND